MVSSSVFGNHWQRIQTDVCLWNYWNNKCLLNLWNYWNNKCVSGTTGTISVSLELLEQ